MKERPLLMTPENAQKCFEGSKTQTRRIVKPQPEEGMKILGPGMYTPCRTDKNGEMYPGEDAFGVYSDDGEWGVVCPYGLVGDRLWIRESWQEKAWSLTELNRAGFLSAPRKPHETYLNQDLYAIHKGGYNAAIGDPGKWAPSIHMPRWACRTVVEITEIRVQRVQEITESDCFAEGIAKEDKRQSAVTTILRFQRLWESINGEGSWSANPFVWVLSFKRVEG